jgi:hypothetical protein
LKEITSDSEPHLSFNDGLHHEEMEAFREVILACEFVTVDQRMIDKETEEQEESEFYLEDNENSDTISEKVFEHTLNLIKRTVEDSLEKNHLAFSKLFKTAENIIGIIIEVERSIEDGDADLSFARL